MRIEVVSFAEMKVTVKLLGPERTVKSSLADRTSATILGLVFRCLHCLSSKCGARTLLDTQGSGDTPI
jgi:hypothetical protein